MPDADGLTGSARDAVEVVEDVAAVGPRRAGGTRPIPQAGGGLSLAEATARVFNGDLHGEEDRPCRSVGSPRPPPPPVSSSPASAPRLPNRTTLRRRRWCSGCSR